MIGRRVILASALLLVLMASGGLFGQDKAATKARGTLPSGWSKLGLTDEQKSQIYAIQGEYRAKIDDLQTQIKGLQKKERAEMAKLLTEAQKDRLREIAASKAVPDSGKDSGKDQKKPPTGSDKK